LYDQNAYAPARDAFSRLVLLEPKAPPPAWALLGLSEFETKNYQDSLRHLERSFVGDTLENPFGRASRYHAALLLTKFGQFESALKLLAQLSAPDTETPELVRAIGVAALRIPLFATAVPPSQFEFTDAVGHAMFDGFVRRERDAEAEYQALLAKYPKFPELHHLHGVALLTSDPVAAIAEFKREIEISPRHVPARLQIAFEYMAEGKAAEALPYAREAVGIEPNLFVAHYALGQALVETGDLKAAITELERARSLAPDSVQTHAKLASAYAKAGRQEDAKREREVTLRLGNGADSSQQR
jgi:tetratricopeptide (TPR) repeat protein